jgi:hypothetical protein
MGAFVASGLIGIAKTNGLLNIRIVQQATWFRKPLNKAQTLDRTPESYGLANEK